MHSRLMTIGGSSFLLFRKHRSLTCPRPRRTLPLYRASMRAITLVDDGVWRRYTTTSPIRRVSTTSLNVASKWVLEDGDALTAACLRCMTPRCRKFDAAEVPTMSADVHLEVCPVRALGADANGVPVAYDNCMGCGLCVLRCPVGAMSLGSDGRPTCANSTVGLVECEGAQPPYPAELEHSNSVTTKALVDEVWVAIGAN
ncbi:hypothetical protein EG829_19065, partial [bacterium]|nr:hypothetical protein [bacterium]